MGLQVKKSTRVIYDNNDLQSVLVEVGRVATRRKEGYLKSFYQKSLIQEGSRKALIALKHKQIIAVYSILKNKEVYKEPLVQNRSGESKKKTKGYSKLR